MSYIGYTASVMSQYIPVFPIYRISSGYLRYCIAINWINIISNILDTMSIYTKTECILYTFYYTLCIIIKTNYRRLLKRITVDYYIDMFLFETSTIFIIWKIIDEISLYKIIFFPKLFVLTVHYQGNNKNYKNSLTS